MKCNNCGFESEQDFAVCSACGNTAEQEYVTTNPVHERVLMALKDKMFLAVCILMTVACGLSIVSGNLPLINVLTTVFLWLVYFASQKGIADVKQLRCVSGTVYASYVITNVFVVLFAVLGVLVGAAISFIVIDANMLDDLRGSIAVEDAPHVLEAFDMMLIGSGWLIASIFIVFAGAILAFNLLGYRKIHRFAKSVYRSIEEHNFEIIEHADAAKIWLWVFAVLGVIGSAYGVADDGAFVLISSGCNAAAMIVSALLVKKYF